MVNSELPLYKYEGPIILIDEEKDVKKAIDILKKEKILGFDLEKKPAFMKGQKNYPALIQMAGEAGVFLFRVCNYILTKDMIQLIQSSEILKVGVGIENDCMDLKTLRVGLCPQRFIDLVEIAKAKGYKSKSLRDLMIEVLNKRLWKPKSLTTSNWASDILSIRQQQYGATDAAASRLLGCELLKGTNEAR